MVYEIDIQHACSEPIPLSDEQLQAFATLTLSRLCDKAELTLRLVTKEEIQALNRDYRQQNKPTNVLAFMTELPDNVVLDVPFLGDVIICPAVLLDESHEKNVPLVAHWAHIVVHGILHLLGFDHINEDDEVRMQAMEISILTQLGYANPYLTEVNSGE